MPPPTDTFTDDELLQIYRNPKADLSLLAPAELGRLDTLTQGATQKPAKSTFVDEPTTYMGGFMKSLGDTASRTGAGIVRGAVDAVNPVNLIRGPLALHEDIWGGNKGAGTIAGLKAIASGDPDAGGQAIGGLTTALIAPHVLPKVPGALVKTGDLMERGGIASRGISKYGLMDAALRGDTKGLAVAAAPYAVQGTGKVIATAGELMGGRPAPVAPVKTPVIRLEEIVAADRARAAAGKPNLPSLVKQPATLESHLADALNEVRQADTANSQASSSGGSISERVARTAAARKHVDPRRVGAYEATPPDLEGDTLQGTTAIRRVDDVPAQTGRIVKANRMLPEGMAPVAAHEPSAAARPPAAPAAMTASEAIAKGRAHTDAGLAELERRLTALKSAKTPEEIQAALPRSMGGQESRGTFRGPYEPPEAGADALHEAQLQLDRERGAALGRILERLARGAGDRR